MKFLGIRNHHDNNITYTDGKTVKYLKLERLLQLKHFPWDQLEEGVEDDIYILLEHAKKTLNIDFRELDAVCVSVELYDHPIDGRLEPNELFKLIDKNKNPFWEQFNCPVYLIDHHYAHSLSCWPIIDLDRVKTHFVFDGLGNHLRNSTIFKNGEIIDFVDVSDNIGFSIYLNRIGSALGIKGSILDLAGKLMALKSYHNLSQKDIFDCLNKTKYYQFRHIKQFFGIASNQQEMINLNNNDKHQIYINLTELLHQFAEVKMPEYFELYADNLDDIITYSGGTAQNTVVNRRIKQKFKNLYIPPHCPDEGISLGCVEFLRRLYNQPEFDKSNFPFWQTDEAPNTTPSASTIEKTAELLARGKIVGWYQGHGEVGPRALGNRSILMDPTIKGGKDIINSRVKHREEYRPFGASVISEYTQEVFDCDYESPYMLYVVDCKDKYRYSSIIHKDGTCRIQTVSQTPENEFYYSLIDKFREKTGIPVLLNTSLNVDGKPIAGYTQDAKTIFDDTELDAIVVGDEISIK